MISVKTTLGIFEIIANVQTLAEANQVMDWVKTLDVQQFKNAAEPIPDLGPKPVPYEEPVFESTEPANDASVTVEEAVALVKDFAARHKPDRARELMKKVGINRTAEINAENAAAVAAAFKEAA